MAFDLKTCKAVVFGYRHTYFTHQHIHSSIWKALQYIGKEAYWFDEKDDLSQFDWENTLIITNHDVVQFLPIRDDCFYVVHGMGDHPEVRELLAPKKLRLSWNVFHKFSHQYGTQGNPLIGITKLGIPLTEQMMLDEDMPFYPREKHMDFRWATDLTPPEIEANKANAKVLNTDSKEINYVGTIWRVNEKEITAFRRACSDGGITFRQFGAGQAGEEFNHLGQTRVVSDEDNARLVRDSYFAPAIVGSHHLIEGYMPCRIVKNISYGCFGVTNSEEVNRIFGGRLIFNPDPYKLFFQAREILPSVPVTSLYALMDYVRDHHTYVSRLNGIFKAVEIISEDA